MSSAAIKRFSPAEYLALERVSEFHQEFFDGEMFRMSGGTIEHSQIAANVIGELRVAFAESFVRSTSRTGRNDACPCGSGKKFKRCCGP